MLNCEGCRGNTLDLNEILERLKKTTKNLRLGLVGVPANFRVRNFPNTQCKSCRWDILLCNLMTGNPLGLSPILRLVFRCFRCKKGCSFDRRAKVCHLSWPYYPAPSLESYWHIPCMICMLRPFCVFHWNSSYTNDAWHLVWWNNINYRRLNTNCPRKHLNLKTMK
jgi:hypothetical protein